MKRKDWSCFGWVFTACSVLGRLLAMLNKHSFEPFWVWILNEWRLSSLEEVAVEANPAHLAVPAATRLTTVAAIVGGVVISASGGTLQAIERRLHLHRLIHLLKPEFLFLQQCCLMFTHCNRHDDNGPQWHKTHNNSMTPTTTAWQPQQRHTHTHHKGMAPTIMAWPAP